MTRTTDANGRDDRLNELWDGLVHGRPVRPADPQEQNQVEAIRAVHHDVDAASGPDPRFLRDLRSTLMDTSLDASRGVVPRPFVPPIPAPGSTRLTRPQVSRRPGFLRRLPAASMRTLEIAATIALLLTTLAFATGERDLRSLFGFRQESTGGTAMYLGDAARTGEMPGPGPTGDIGLLWRLPDGERKWTPDSSPVVVDGVVYVATRHHDVAAGTVDTGMAAIDLASGRILWEHPLPGFLYDGQNGGPAVAGGRVYVALSTETWLGGPPATPTAGATPTTVAHMAGVLVALDAKNGEQVWRYDDLARAGDHPPAVADGTVFVVAEDGALHAVDAESGERRWTASVSDEPWSGLVTSPAVAGDTVYAASNLGRLHAFDVATGDEFWSAEIGGNTPTMPVVGGETVFIGAYTGEPFAPETDLPSTSSPTIVNGLSVGSQRLYALDTATGAERWSLDLEIRELMPMRTAPTVAGEAVLLTGLGPESDEIVALATADGTELWRAATDGNVVVPAVWSGETVYLGSADARLYALDLSTGTVQWSVVTGGIVLTAAFVVDGIVLFGSGDGDLYAVGSVEPGAGTPAASSVPDGDLSGLPPCDVEPRPALVRGADGRWIVPVAGDGAPPASVVPIHDPSESRQQAAISWDELPTGEPAPAATVEAIRATIVAMNACARPGYANHLAAFYSDDFMRREWVQIHQQFNGYFTWAPGATGADLDDFESAVVLPDGRVATVFRYSVGSSEGSSTDHGYLVVWVEIDGRWQIDEWAEISDSGVFRG